MQRVLPLLCMWLGAGCMAHRTVGTSGAELHRAQTEDGWQVALERLRPLRPSARPPILLCPGVASGPRSVDLDEAHSLARWLQRQGRDTWVLSLRGSGRSDRIDRSQGRMPYGFDALWKQDLTAAVRYIRQHTGREVDLVGNSLGGMMVYAYLSQRGEGVNAAVTLGAPTRLDWGGFLEYSSTLIADVAVVPDSNLPLEPIAQVLLPFHAGIRGNPIEVLLYNPENVTPQTWSNFIRFGITSLTGPVALYLVRMLHTGRFRSADETIDYRSDMARIVTPVLVVAGKLDRLAVVPGVRDGFRALGGPKEWLLVGKESGAQADYGHVDLMLGERAADEVWPHLLDFLDRHSPQPPPH